jgi:hypothetical protein
MTDLAAKLAELASKWRRTPALLAADAAADDLATFVDDNLAAILTAIRASRPEPAADAVEAVAEAIWKHQLVPFEPGWAYESEGAKKHFRDCARAALAAAQEPDHA